MDTGRQKIWFGDAKRHYEQRRQTPQKILDGRWTPTKIPLRTPDAKPILPLIATAVYQYRPFGKASDIGGGILCKSL